MAAPRLAERAKPDARTPDSDAQNAQTGSQQAYQLPPDKLAKAIAISRIRNTMDIVNGLWGLAFLWLLLATGISARIEELGEEHGAAALDAGGDLLCRRSF